MYRDEILGAHFDKKSRAFILNHALHYAWRGGGFMRYFQPRGHRRQHSFLSIFFMHSFNILYCYASVHWKLIHGKKRLSFEVFCFVSYVSTNHTVKRVPFIPQFFIIMKLKLLSENGGLWQSIIVNFL